MVALRNVQISALLEGTMCMYMQVRLEPHLQVCVRQASERRRNQKAMQRLSHAEEARVRRGFATHTHLHVIACQNYMQQINANEHV